MTPILPANPLRTLEHNLPNGAVFRLERRSDGAYRFAHISNGVESLAAVTPAEVLADANAFFSRVLDEDLPRLWVGLEQSAANGSLIDLAVRVRGGGGVIRWAEFRSAPHLLPDGETAWDGFLLDDTERKRAELLLSAEARVSALLSDFPQETELWPDLLPLLGEQLLWDVAECWRLADDGLGLRRTAVWCRPEPRLRHFAEESTGWRFPTGDGLPGLAWNAGEPVWMPDLIESPFFRRRELAADAGLGCAVGVPVRVGGGCVGVVALFGRPVGQDFPAMRAFLGSLGRTLSRYLEHHRAERAVLRAKVAAERANRAKDRFLANVSHELRTPLAGILGTVDLALGDAADLTIRDRLETIRDCGESLLGIVNDLLDVAKTRAGKVELRPAPFDLRQELSKGLRTLADRAAAKSVRFELHLTDDVPAWVVGDAARLRQILVNLVGNAVKFTERGKVSVSVSVSGPVNKPGCESGSATADAGPTCLPTRTPALRFAVRDTGIGIPPDKLRAVFRPFEQVDGSTARKYGGTGLGLPIASELVRRMGGRLRVKSKPGVGSRFSFAVVLPTAEPPESATPTARANQPSRPLRVLLAEDNSVVRRVTAELLRRAGHRVTSVGNGTAAVTALGRRRFDVVLMDLHMPGMGGLETAATIREADAASGRRTPIVAFTASATTGDVTNCQSAGLDGFVSKPIDLSELLAALDAAVGEPVGATTRPPEPPITAETGTAELLDDVLDPPQVLIARVGGYRELLTQLAPKIAADAERLLAEASAAADRGDWPAVAASGHKLAGLVGLISSAGCAAARRLEAVALSGTEQERRQQLEATLALVARLGETIRSGFPLV